MISVSATKISQIMLRRSAHVIKDEPPEDVPHTMRAPLVSPPLSPTSNESVREMFTPSTSSSPQNSLPPHMMVSPGVSGRLLPSQPSSPPPYYPAPSPLVREHRLPRSKRKHTIVNRVSMVHEFVNIFLGILIKFLWEFWARR